MKRIFTHIWILVLFLSACANAQSVSVEEFEKGLQETEGVQLLDVRSADEFKSGRIAGAMQANVNDYDEFEELTKALDKNKPVYVYCLAGSRSHTAAQTLRSQGYKEVVELDGGMNAWRKAGKPTEGTSDVKMMQVSDYQKLVASAPVVLVDFGAEWCPPCRKMEPRVAALQQEYPNLKVVKIDGGEQDVLMKEYNVEALPTFILYKEGKQVWRGRGLMEQEELNGAVAKHL